jgi:8-oxo-dGTP pyrophosphatase MutT (NUDIX family)
MLEFEFLVRGRFAPDQISVHYNAALHIELTDELQSEMERIWQEKLVQAQQQNFQLFDGKLFRMIDVEQLADSTLSLTLGNTSYKEYIATRTPAFVQQLTRKGISNALAGCSVIETLDGFLLLEQRQGTDAHNGRFHVIGGFMERDIDNKGHAPDPFAAMNREMREETGIQTDDIREQYCLGLAYDTLLPHPELCFVTRLKIPLATVSKRKAEDNEVQMLRVLRVTAASLKESILSNHGNFSPTGEAALILYGSWKFGTGWFDEVMSGIEK